MSELKPKLYRFIPDEGCFRWSDVELKQYKDEKNTWKDVCRQVIAGKRGENLKFHLRYFEVAPGGYTTLEKHEHEHVVICVRGSGKAIAGDEVFDMKFMDVLYVSPNTPHQFINTGDEPFGFFCIVDAERDRPKPLTQDEISKLFENEKIRNLAKLPDK